MCKLNFVVALSPEAKPIIQHYRLQKVPGNHSFTLFSNGTIELIVSGVGTVAAAAATGYLAARRCEQQTTAWLNVGIAGSLNRDVGATVLAHSVTDVVNGQRYYPSLIFNPMCDTASIITVPKPETRYDNDRVDDNNAINDKTGNERTGDGKVYDMEASGFYATATRFSSNELVHCFKVISDNEHNPAAAVNGQQVKRLITEQIEKIDQLVNEVQRLAEKLSENKQSVEDYHMITERFHFTVSQQLKLKSYINHWYALTNCLLLEKLVVEDYRSAKALLIALQAQLSDMPLSYLSSVRSGC